VAFRLNKGCTLVDRKLLWFRQCLTRAQVTARSAPWVQPIPKAMGLLYEALAAERDEYTGSEQRRFVESVKLYGRLFHLVERSVGVRVPHYLLRPLSRLLESVYFQDKPPSLAFAAMDVQFNYCADSFLGPALLSDCLLLGADPNEVPSELSRLAVVGVPAGDEDDALQHCLVAHELGHVVLSFAGLEPPRMDIHNPKVDAESDEHLSNWPTELACDVLGIHMVGPAFLLALRRRIPQYEPSRSHPSTNLRSLACMWAMEAFGGRRFSTYLRTAIRGVSDGGKTALQSAVARECQDRPYTLLNFRECLRKFIRTVRHRFGAGPGCAGDVLQTEEPRDTQPVEALLHYVPPAHGQCNGDRRTGEVRQVPHPLGTIWLAGWLVESDQELWADFIRPFPEEQRSAGEPQRRLSLLVAKAIEAADILQRMAGGATDA